MINKISILIPVYNEEKTLQSLLKKVVYSDVCKLEKEIIIIDDCSTDSSLFVLKKLKKQYKEQIIIDSHKTNKCLQVTKEFGVHIGVHENKSMGSLSPQILVVFSTSNGPVPRKFLETRLEKPVVVGTFRIPSSIKTHAVL